MIRRYKTKPCEIEAIQWTGENKMEISNFIDEGLFYFSNHSLFIETLEGAMKANQDDYIIRGLRGEYYPCKPDVFAKKYEVIECDMPE